MEIQENEYVRIKNGVITQLTEITTYYREKIYWFDKILYRDYGGDGIDFLRQIQFEGYIIKHSFNIIDLIEEGDYVNGKRVIYVASIENKDDEEELCVFVEETQDCIEAQEIKSIVTKEQFESIKYEV